jgi:predicted dehydrogenase
MQLHDDTNLACLQAGKHLYTEKTAATNNERARLLEREAAARNLTLVCAPCDMVWPQILLAKELLTQNAIGEVHSARGIGHGGVPPWSGFPSDPSPFFAKGGGPHRDMGVYPLHALTGLLGPARQVKAMSAKAQAGFTIGDGPFAGKCVPMEEDDTWLMLLDHGNGVISSVEANNSVQSSKAPQLELFGLKGTIALNIIDCAAPIDLLQTDKGWNWQTVDVPHERAGGPDHILGVQHLVECLQTGKTPALSIAHAAHVIEILDAAAASSATGSAITINSVF